MLETFRDMNEVREAILAAREAAGPDLAIIAQLSIEDDGRLRDGTSTADFTQKLDELPVDVIGLNCSSGPKVMLETIEKMAAYTKKPLSAMPNAGLPTTFEGRNIYLCSPEYMAQYARRFLLTGVQIVGGCCGTTADHIKEIKAEARSLQHVEHAHSVVVDEPTSRPQAMEKIPVAESGLGAKLAALENSSPSWEILRRAASMRRKRSRALSSAKPPASIASMFRTAPEPAPG